MKKMNEYADENQLALYKNFPSTHYLSNQKNVLNTIAWITFFRRNMHRCAIDYLGIKIYPYQALMLYELGINDLFNTVGSRNIAKSFIIGLYACCHAVLYPNSEVVIASATLKQAELIIAHKIQNELMNMSPQLRAEIKDIKRINGCLYVIFHNGSTIGATVSSDNARGLRSTLLIRDESRLMKKKIDDSILSPFQHVRRTDYCKNKYYANMPECIEEPKNVYITSSWLEDGNWIWDIADTAFRLMLNHKGQALLAFDESVVLAHTLKTRKQLILEKRKLDDLSWSNK